MDISLNFREVVQASIFQFKKVEDIEKINILKRIRKKNSFVIIVDLICNQINEFYNAIHDNEEAYQSFSNLLTNKSSSNVVDDETEMLARTLVDGKCLQLIKDLKRRIMHSDLCQQNEEHNKIIISVIEEYLRTVCKMYSEQKILRTRQVVAMKHVYSSKRSFNNIPVDSFDIQELNGDTCQPMNIDHYQLKPKDIQLFETENEQLYNELNNLTEEVKEIENKVVSISELQNIFSEKVLDQDKGLEHMLGTVAGSTENVKEANEQIRNAIQRNAGFRVWILFFLLVLSFSLIFLDWYKP